MTESEKLKSYLDELTALTHKYGMQIVGCGCCGSPYLAYVGEEEEPVPILDADKLEYDTEKQEYILHYSGGMERVL